MVGVAVIFEEEGVAREGPVGALDALRDGPGSGCGAGAGARTLGEAGRRSCTSAMGSTADGDGSPSTGMRVALTGGLVGPVGFRMGDLAGGGRIDGRRGFGRRTGGVSCCKICSGSEQKRLGRSVLRNSVLVPLGACNLRDV